MSPLLPELAGARVTAIDGPQGLARSGSRMRESERRLAAPGKTPDVLPASGPYAGFLRSSVELFAALHAAHVPISSTEARGVFEVYPGRLWADLAGARLPRKRSAEGLIARKNLLAALGIGLNTGLEPTHDQLDACVAAVVAAALAGAIDGIKVHRAGPPLEIGESNVLREGPILYLEVESTTVRRAIDASLAGSPRSVEAVVQRPRRPGSKTRRLEDDSPTQTSNPAAQSLLEELVSALVTGTPTVLSYQRAYALLVRDSATKWSQGYTQQVLSLCRQTHPVHVPGLGPVALDAFILAKSTRMPSAGHWSGAPYSSEDWQRLLGSAILDPSDWPGAPRIHK